MSLNRRHFLTGAVAAAAVPATPLFAQSRKATPVVATFSVLGDMVARIGGDRIALTTLVGPNGDAHVYKPTPADARAVAEASLLVANGLAFEGWLDRLVKAAPFKGQNVVATDGVKTIAFEEEHGHDGHDKHEGHDKHDDHDKAEHGHKEDGHKKHADEKDDHDEHDHDKHGHEGHDHGEFDPHAWHDLKNGEVYARNIAKGLTAADPKGASAYKEAAERYIAEMRALDEEIRAMLGALPAERRTIVTPHDAFGYFAKAYGLEFLAPQGFSTESEPSAADVARLITQIKKRGIDAVFIENVTDKRLIEQIARETGAKVGGTLYSDALSAADAPAATYLDMMRHNATTIAGALSS
ncbi:MAG: metal ABC transporter substrate-binding protein [Neomegalonema sp.]|nr:metal ABC transporter substrate-binding protein [Neomegalonema sp.]